MFWKSMKVTIQTSTCNHASKTTTKTAARPTQKEKTTKKPQQAGEKNRGTEHQNSNKPINNTYNPMGSMSIRRAK
jgi:hypothetical protein